MEWITRTRIHDRMRARACKLLTRMMTSRPLLCHCKFKIGSSFLASLLLSRKVNAFGAKGQMFRELEANTLESAKGAIELPHPSRGIDDADGRSREQALPAWTRPPRWLGWARLRVFNDNITQQKTKQ